MTLSVLLVTPGFPDRDDRYTPGIVDTLVALAKRGVSIDVHALRRPPAVRHTVFRGLPITAHGEGGAVRRHLSLLAEVRARHRRERYDVIWSIWPNLTGPAAVAAKTMLGVPLVASLAGSELADMIELRYANPRRRRVRTVLTAADAITAGAEPLAARARSLGHVVEVCPLGVMFEQIARRPPRRTSRVVVFDDGSPIKRVPMALAAAAQLDGTLTVFGGRAGFVPPRAVRRQLADHDVMIHASGHESQGIGLIEAAYAGLAIACFDVGIARRLQALGGRLAIASRTSAEGLADAARAAQELPYDDGSRIEAELSADACAARFESVLRSVR